MRYLKLFEDYTTGSLKVGDLVLSLYVQQSNVTNVYLLLGDDIYDNLSVELPDSEQLDIDEFFLNPELDTKIVDELVNQGFIEEGENETTAGDKPTKSYRLV
jgi:hypothetical protein